MAPNYETVIVARANIRKIIPTMLSHLFKNVDENSITKLLDVGTGTGLVILELFADALSKNSQVQIEAFDVSQGMIDSARQNLEKFLSDDQCQRVHLQVLDAQQLSYADESFDLAAASFVYMFLQDRAKGYRELHRVLKKGGRYVFICSTSETLLFAFFFGAKNKTRAVFTTWKYIEALAFPFKVLSKWIPNALEQFFLSQPGLQLRDPDLLKQSLLEAAPFASVQVESHSVSNFLVIEQHVQISWDLVKQALDEKLKNEYMEEARKQLLAASKDGTTVEFESTCWIVTVAK